MNEWEGATGGFAEYGTIAPEDTSHKTSMATPYGPCGHTHYEGGPPCIHSAYVHGFEDGRESVQGSD